MQKVYYQCKLHIVISESWLAERQLEIFQAKDITWNGAEMFKNVFPNEEKWLRDSFSPKARWIL